MVGYKSHKRMRISLKKQNQNVGIHNLMLRKSYSLYKITICEGPFLDSVQAQVEARTLGLLVVV